MTSRMPGATWRPVPNRTPNGQQSVRGVVVHIMAGTLTGTDSWFRNPRAQASSHFGTGKAGSLYQWVSTQDRAWAQGSGNRDWLSVENEGKGGDKLTDAQLDRNAQVLAWAHREFGVPLQVASSPTGRGLGYHGMGGSAWGGHTACPGSKIVAQLPEIVKRAKKLADDPSPTPAPAEQPAGSGLARHQATLNGLTYGYGAHGDHVTAVGRALVAKGHGDHYKTGPGPNWTDADTRNYADWQRSLGYRGTDADGVPGETSLTRLLGTLPGKAKAPAKKPAPSYEPFPGAGFFHGGRHSRIVTAMGRRLVAEGCGRYRSGPGPNWTNADRASYAAYQRKLGYTGADANGIPGPTSWAKLRVPKS